MSARVISKYQDQRTWPPPRDASKPLFKTPPSPCSPILKLCAVNGRLRATYGKVPIDAGELTEAAFDYLKELDRVTRCGFAEAYVVRVGRVAGNGNDHRLGVEVCTRGPSEWDRLKHGAAAAASGRAVSVFLDGRLLFQTERVDMPLLPGMDKSNTEITR